MLRSSYVNLNLWKMIWEIFCLASWRLKTLLEIPMDFNCFVGLVFVSLICENFKGEKKRGLSDD